MLAEIADILRTGVLFPAVAGKFKKRKLQFIMRHAQISDDLRNVLRVWTLILSSDFAMRRIDEPFDHRPSQT